MPLGTGCSIFIIQSRISTVLMSIYLDSDGHSLQNTSATALDCCGTTDHNSSHGAGVVLRPASITRLAYLDSSSRVILFYNKPLGMEVGRYSTRDYPSGNRLNYDYIFS